jgi:hypothetical protein
MNGYVVVEVEDPEDADQVESATNTAYIKIHNHKYGLLTGNYSIEDITIE